MTSPLPEALLLDLDDTILEGQALYQRTWRLVGNRYAPKLDVEPVEFLEAVWSYGTWFWSDEKRALNERLNPEATRPKIVTGALEKLSVNKPDLVAEIADMYRTERDASLKPFPGTLDAINSFIDEGIKLALITNGAADTQRAKVERFDLEPLFDCIVIEGEFGVGKPDERVFKHALDALDASPSDAWMVGDNIEHDVGGAQALGIHGVWIDNQGAGPPETTSVRPDRIIRLLAELAPA